MINKENFLNLVDSSINFSGENYAYLIVDDETPPICPFCERPVKVKKTSITCDCNMSGNYSADLEKALINIKEEQKKIDHIKNIVRKESLDFFKKRFSDIIVPQLEQEMKNTIHEILNLKLDT